MTAEFLGIYLFYGTALLVLLSALGVVISRKPLYSALWLVLCLLGTAAVYGLLQAHFLAVLQVLVYAGAIVVLMLFVLMLLGGADERRTPGAALLGIAAALTGASFVWALAPLFEEFRDAGASRDPSAAALQGSVNALGRALYGRFVFPFEAASLLILVALVAAILLARRRADGGSLKPCAGNDSEVAK